MNRISVTQDACYHCTGRLELRAADGTLLARHEESWLCACGASRDKPYCDGSHALVDFRNGTPPAADAAALPADSDAALIIRTRKDGPLKLDGPFEIVAPDGSLLMRASESALCRCGHSARKPFCDGTHRSIRFRA
jgi:CDGSH-type Zn-finger protein